VFLPCGTPWKISMKKSGPLDHGAATSLKKKPHNCADSPLRVQQERLEVVFSKRLHAHRERLGAVFLGALPYQSVEAPLQQ
jgi:hypothetical protein